MANGPSSGETVGDRFYIFDGKTALVFDGEMVLPLSEKAYVPTVLISKSADECEKETVLKGDGASKKFMLEQKPKEITVLTVEGNEANFILSEAAKGKCFFL